MTIVEQLRKLHEDLTNQLLLLNEELVPIQKEYDSLAVKMNELDKLQRPLGDKLKDKKSEINSLGQQLKGLNISLDSFKEPVVATEGISQVAEGYEGADPVPEENLV